MKMLKPYPWLDRSEDFRSDAVLDLGWKNLIDRLFADIDAVMADSGAVLVMLQIKEKLGTLRFYRRYRDASDIQIARVAELVGAAVDESCRTCIACGHPGILANTSGWIACLCEKHVNIAPI